MPALLRSIPNSWGPKFGTESGAVTRTRTGPNEIILTTPANLALVMLTPQPNREVALNSDRKSIALAPIGSIEIVPAGSELFARWTVDKNLLLALDPPRLARLAGMEFDNPDFELLPPKIGFVDRKALFLSHLNVGTLLTICVSTGSSRFSPRICCVPIRPYAATNPNIC